MKILSPAEVKILVVDDTPAIRLATVRLLEKAGYQVTQAASGEAALVEAQRQRPDLLLMDRDMPGIDGIETCRRVKHDLQMRDSLVIMASGSYADTAQQSEGLEAGADGYIARPIANRELLARIEAYVRILSLTRTLRFHIEELEKTNVTAQAARLASLNLMEDAVAAQARMATVNQALQQSEALLLEAQEISMLGSYTLNIISGEWTCSKTLNTIFGIAQSDLRTVDSWLALIHPEDRKLMEDYFWQEVFAQRQNFDKDYRIIRRSDQAERWVHGLGRLEFDAQGLPVVMHGTIQDITERKVAMEANQRLMVAIDQAAESIVFTDVHGAILYVNQGFEKCTGYTRAEVIGQNPRVLKSGKQPDDYYKTMWATISRGEVWHGRFINKRKDGDLYEEEVTISPVHNAAGKIVSFVAVKRDITREKQLEQQLFEAQKMEAIGQLAGGVAHDYNNILAATIIQLSLLMTDKSLSPEVQEALVDLRKGADRAASLTRQLLMFSRRQPMQKKPLELNALLNDELKMLRRLLGEHIQLNIRGQASEAWIEGDPGMMEQVIMNLCINARDAMAEGGRLTFGISQVELADTTELPPQARPGKFICFSVADQGHGMTEETMTRIFEPFFTTKGVGKGTGLGLATVYGIVKQHDGWVEVSSQIGQGSEFRVYLPESADKRSVTTGAAPSKITMGKETILIVEDDEAVRQSVVLVLKYAGYRTFEAENGPEALEAWSGRINQIDLLLTDMVMPGGISGLAMAQAFKKLKPELPVILTSGYSNELVEAGTHDHPEFTFVAKPYDVGVLTATVRKILNQRPSLPAQPQP